MPNTNDTSGTSSGSAGMAPMDFSTFILSLGSSAMVNLGAHPAPDATNTKKDLAAAHQIIEILGILQEKTKGNLTEAEQKLIDGIVYDLRIRYVDAQKS